MDAPQPAEDVRPFIKIAELFQSMHLTVPQVLAQDVEQGFLVLTDLGTTMYSHMLNHDTAHKLYMDAIESLVSDVITKAKTDVLPEYDRAFLQRELMIFPEWYISKHRGVFDRSFCPPASTKSLMRFCNNNESATAGLRSS